jgi:hypothetical protein
MSRTDDSIRNWVSHHRLLFCLLLFAAVAVPVTALVSPIVGIPAGIALAVAVRLVLGLLER